MKVFISHKKEDAQIALDLSRQLEKNGVSFYLDVLDASVTCDSKRLTDHIKAALNDCTDIMVVMSENTRFSQWVPFEIGMSAQRDMPTVTFLKSEVALPEFLAFWPRLKRIVDVDAYVQVRNRTKAKYDIQYRGKTLLASERKTAELNAFYTDLKKVL